MFLDSCVSSLLSSEIQKSCLAILVTTNAYYMQFTVLRKGSPFFSPKVIQFRVPMKSREETDKEGSRIFRGFRVCVGKGCFTWGICEFGSIAWGGKGPMTGFLADFQGLLSSRVSWWHPATTPQAWSQGSVYFGENKHSVPQSWRLHSKFYFHLLWEKLGGFLSWS